MPEELETRLSKPSCFRISRRTSAIVTLSVTWSSPSNLQQVDDLRWLAVFGKDRDIALLPPVPVAVSVRVVASPPFRKAWARSAACVASCGVRTVPVSTMLSETISTLMLESGMKRLQIGFEAGDVALDFDIEADDLLAIASEDEDVRLADLLAEQIDAARRAGHGVGHRRIGDENIMRVLRQIDDERLVEAELEAAVSTGAGLRDPDDAFGFGMRNSRADERREGGWRQAGNSRSSARGGREEKSSAPHCIAPLHFPLLGLRRGTGRP